MKVLTSSQMFSAEQAQVNRGMSFTRLMENAGSACAVPAVCGCSGIEA